MNDPRVGNLTREDAAMLKSVMESTGCADAMPAWMTEEIRAKTQPETLVVPRELFEQLTEAAKELERNAVWKSSSQLAELFATVEAAQRILKP